MSDDAFVVLARTLAETCADLDAARSDLAAARAERDAAAADRYHTLADLIVLTHACGPDALRESLEANARYAAKWFQLCRLAGDAPYDCEPQELLAAIVGRAAA